MVISNDYIINRFVNTDIPTPPTHPPGQNGGKIVEDNFKCNFVNEIG